MRSFPGDGLRLRVEAGGEPAAEGQRRIEAPFEGSCKSGAHSNRRSCGLNRSAIPQLRNEIRGVRSAALNSRKAALEKIGKGGSTPCGRKAEDETSHCIERTEKERAGTQRRKRLPLVGGEGAVGADEADGTRKRHAGLKSARLPK